ncbi:MAG: hypothetical protein L0Y67_07100 [Gammaproteobacteria bacterium]|nr:hypothetical protein [Gammaproteobacteria bacterium]
MVRKSLLKTIIEHKIEVLRLLGKDGAAELPRFHAEPQFDELNQAT